MHSDFPSPLTPSYIFALVSEVRILGWCCIVMNDPRHEMRAGFEMSLILKAFL